MSNVEHESSTPLPEFNGNPALYKKLSIMLSFGVSIYLYLGMVVINYVILGKSWIFGWLPIALTVLFAAWYAFFSFKRMMKLDAQYGTGKGWEFPSEMIKLPRRRQRPKKT